MTLGYAADPEMGYEAEAPMTFSSTSNLYIATEDVGDALWLRFNVTDASTSAIIAVKAGDGPRSGLGDYEWLVPDHAVTYASAVMLGPLESARFRLIKNTSATRRGTIEVDISPPTNHRPITGNVTGYKAR